MTRAHEMPPSGRLLGWILRRTNLAAAGRIILCACVLAACGAPIAAPTPAAVSLRFGFRTGIADYVPLAEEFHHVYPNITVKLVELKYGQGLTGAQGLGSGQSAFEVMNLDAFRDAMPYTPDSKMVTALLPLDDRIDANKSFPRNDIFAGALDALKFGGTQYGLPAGLDPMVAFYDRARFNTKKATPPDPTWTISDFVQAAVSVNDQSGNDSANPNSVYGFCSDPQGTDPIVLTYLFGGQLVDSVTNPTRATLDAPANVTALEWYASLRQKYAVTPDPDDARQLYHSRGVAEAAALGRCGLWFGFYADVNVRPPTGMKQVSDPVMLPLPRGQASFNVASLDGYFIMRQSAQPGAAWEWISFLMDHESASGRLVPPLQSEVGSSSFARRVGSDALAVAERLPSDLITLGSGTPQGAASLFSIYAQAVDSVVRGQSEARPALQAAQVQAQALMSSGN